MVGCVFCVSSDKYVNELKKLFELLPPNDCRGLLCLPKGVSVQKIVVNEQAKRNNCRNCGAPLGYHDHERVYCGTGYYT